MVLELLKTFTLSKVLLWEEERSRQQICFVTQTMLLTKHYDVIEFWLKFHSGYLRAVLVKLYVHLLNSERIVYTYNCVKYGNTICILEWWDFLITIEMRIMDLTYKYEMSMDFWQNIKMNVNHEIWCDFGLHTHSFLIAGRCFKRLGGYIIKLTISVFNVSRKNA